jgi:hypothetical protein
MLFTEQRWWRVTAGAFAGLILAGALGAPALATTFPSHPLLGLDGRVDLRVPVADFPRVSTAAGGESGGPASGTAASAPRAPQAAPPPAYAPPARPVAPPPPSEDRVVLQRGDLDILAHLVQAEAGDEPYVGKVAVAAVVMNRTLSGRFPRSVYGVVFERDAFESVSNGWYWYPPSASDYRAVRDALRGWDPTAGALFFFNPAKTANAFIWSRPIILRIGNHLFTR